MQWRWLVNEDEIARQIFKSQGLDPNRFVPQKAPPISQVPEWVVPQELSQSISASELIGQDIASLSTPQLNFWNWWQWPQ